MKSDNKKYKEQPSKKIVFLDGSIIIEYKGGIIIVEAKVKYLTSPVIKMKYCSISRN